MSVKKTISILGSTGSIGTNTINVITYEKGIEKIMRSCGSGSVAAAFYAYHNGNIKSPLKILNPGGYMMLEFNSSWEDVWLFSHPSVDTESEVQLD